MTRSQRISNPPPPLLSMDEYADFLEASLRELDMVRVAKQKELEERIEMPFRITGDNQPAENGKKNET